MFRRKYSEEVYQGDNTRNFEFGVFDSDNNLIDISSDYTCKVITDGVDRSITDMNGSTLFTFNLTAAEVESMAVGCHDVWVIIENEVVSEPTRTTYRVDLNVLENEVADE